MVRVVDERVVKNAVEQRKSFIHTNASTLSMKALRALLEEDLKVPPQTLRPFKALIEEKALKVVAKGVSKDADSGSGEEDQSEDSDTENKPASKDRKRKQEKPSSRKEKHPKQDKVSKGSKKASDQVIQKSKKTKHEEEEPKKKKQKRASSPPPTKSAGQKQHSSEVRRLQHICQRATVKIPPNVYKGGPDDSELALRLTALLKKHNLSGGVGEREIARAKAQLQTARELEGIDADNIVEGGRRSRRQAAPSINYRDMQGSSDSDDEQAEDGGADSSDESDARPAQLDNEVTGSVAEPSEEAEESSEEAECGAKGAKTSEAPCARRHTVLDDSEEEEGDKHGSHMENHRTARSSAGRPDPDKAGVRPLAADDAGSGGDAAMDEAAPESDADQSLPAAAADESGAEPCNGADNSGREDVASGRGQQSGKRQVTLLDESDDEF